MRINGAKLFIKNWGWLVGLCFFLLAIFFPPLPPARMLYYRGGPGALYIYEGTWGGIFWHVWDVRAYLQWQFFARNPSAGRILLTEFAPYGFVPVALLIFTIISWRWIVSRAKNSNLLVLRGLLAVVVAFVCSLILAYLLGVVGGHLLLAAISVHGIGQVEIEGLISGVWQTSISQAIWLFLPCLVIGALLAWWQQTLWRKHLLVAPVVP